MKKEVKLFIIALISLLIQIGNVIYLSYNNPTFSLIVSLISLVIGLLILSHIKEIKSGVLSVCAAILIIPNVFAWVGVIAVIITYAVRTTDAAGIDVEVIGSAGVRISAITSFIFALITAFFAIFLGSGGEKEENGI